MSYRGLVHRLDEAVYHRQPGLSSTGAKKILKSPAHYDHYVKHREEPKAEFDLGSAVHAKVLGVGAQIAVYPDGTGTEEFEYDGQVLTNVLATNGAISTKAAKAFELDARENGLIPVKRVTARVVDLMAESVLSNPIAAKLLTDGRPEVSMFETDPDTGVPMRGRIDWLGKRIIDLKTTAGDASENEFAIHAFRYGYDIQNAWYEHLHHLITGETLPYLFIVVETTAPYLTAVHRLGEDELLMARRRAREARERYARCTETGEWPGYNTRTGQPIGILRAPVWNVNQYIDEFQGSAA
ncbi:PD-(D/E)XK nuclease-like domain-containing protein [Microbacterium plantarum]|uniref:PD-(D/E)XK nuclease-like domain-containing protein n=1 Tax=Microbacterium plantarum TaxID=1816425 RepID=UPI002B47B20A|nr:PD-(D/E)XK nuclease-like domain-containing protein [Microbacterium plantarum]WRK16533.1 PD-(D/E)XK nuclease-like domain-containing protein [Microbacterium plantarum]